MRYLLRGFVVVVLALAPLHAWAQDEPAGSSTEDSSGELSKAEQDEFRALTASANEKFQAEDFDGAIRDFKAAYAIKPVSNILYNVARLHEKNGQLEDALEFYQRFARAPNVDKGPRQDAVERIKTIRDVLDLDREEEPSAEPASAPVAAEESAAEPDRTLAYVFWGIGGAAILGGAVFGILTMSANGDFDDAQTLEERRDAADTGETFGLVADSLFVGGAVMGIVGTVLYLTASGSSESSAASVFPVVSDHSAGIGFRSNF